MLVEPTYGYAGPDGGPYRPTVRQVLREWLDAMDAYHHPARRLTAAFFVFHIVTGLVGAVSLVNSSWDGWMFGVAAGLWIVMVYNTVWYHRYCSHAAFSFSSMWFARVLLWTNPFALREEMFAIPHRVHHERSDRVGDPYGPHLGWLGSYLATESQQKINTAIDERRWDALARSLRHIGFPINSYKAFQRTGSIEQVWHYVARTIFAQTLWTTISYGLGGWHYVSVWYAALFVVTFYLREFPWRGHGGNFRTTKIAGWEFDPRSRSLNNSVFGYLAGEWHDNHHLLPASANCAFLPGQLDVPFQIIRLCRRLGIVTAYFDGSETFKQRIASSPATPEERSTSDTGADAILRIQRG